MTPEKLSELLNMTLPECLGDEFEGSKLTDLIRLSGGANNETWSLRWGEKHLILRRRSLSPESAKQLEENILGISLSDEASVIQLVSETAVPVPKIHAVFDQNHPIGEAFLMAFIPGESIPNRWLTTEVFNEARGKLPHQCGAALAQIHSIDCRKLPEKISGKSMSERFIAVQKRLHAFGDVSPIMQLGLNWLIDQAPEDMSLALLHGDFRTGNLLIDESGLAAVLDWELTHQGPVGEDLGYLCANVWRFGQLTKPVGGFGEYDALLSGYESVAGWAPDLNTIKYWEIFASLSWGLVCMTMGALWHSGQGDIERAAVARRRSEAELDLLLLIEDWESDGQR